MSDIKLFRVQDEVCELEGSAVALEKSLQTLIEKDLETFFAVRFLESEYTIDGGRMDTLGIDENGCPVIIEYKRSSNENVVNQGLFYLDWLMSHKKNFEWLVMERLGKEIADNVEWSAPRLICIAGDFTKYDAHAVNQMDRNIELVRYRRFGDDLLLFDLVNATTATTPVTSSEGKPTKYKTVSEYLAQASTVLKDRFESLKATLEGLGDDVQMKTLKNYYAFRRLKNFACVEVHPQQGSLTVFVKVNPDSVSIEEGFTRDMCNLGHFGTGDLAIFIANDDALEKAIPLIKKSYEVS